MTRHAKKTHANFYDSSERLDTRGRQISTPLPGEEQHSCSGKCPPELLSDILQQLPPLQHWELPTHRSHRNGAGASTTWGRQDPLLVFPDASC